MSTVCSIGVTAGDPGGVGPEVLLRALYNTRGQRAHWPQIKVFGDLKHFERIAQRFQLDSIRTHTDILFVDCPIEDEAPFELGVLTDAGARAQVLYIQKALEAIDSGDIQGIVTAPIHKQALARCELPYHGHTEWLADHAQCEVTMMLAGPILRTVPVTCHIPLSEVPSALNTQGILSAIRQTHRALVDWFGIATPRIAVCGLNPHAGDEGLLGHEDDAIVRPAIEQARSLDIQATGPYPGDTVFFFAHKGEYDAVIAMYHDQALGPLKLVHFDEAVNVTLGLPFIRTSVDHGTAYDIASLGTARSTSMEHALELAVSVLS